MQPLQQLLENINTQVENNGIINVLELRHLLKGYSGEDWSKHLKSENGKPATTVLVQNEQVKVVLIYWDAYKKSKKHGHPAGGGLIKLLSGNLIETRFDPENTDSVIGKYQYSAGNMSYIHDRLAYHTVENPSDEPAVSLHVYSQGIYASKVVEKPRTAKAIELALSHAA